MVHNLLSLCHRVVATKYCLPAKIFIELVTIVCESPETNIVSNLLQHLKCGAAKFLAYKMADTVYGKRTC